MGISSKIAPAGRNWRFWSAVAVALGLATAITLGAVLARDPLNDAVSNVLQGSSFFATLLTNTSNGLPRGGTLALPLALVAGMVAAVNPCGFAVLPAYLSLYLQDGAGAPDADKGGRGAQGLAVTRQLLRALTVSLTIGLGFVVLFGSVGALIATLSAALTGGSAALGGGFTGAFAWIGLVLGVVMVGLGVFTMLGGKLYSAAPQRYASKIGSPQQTNLWGYFLFGISYALASLSCTLPLFIAIMTNSLTNNGALGVGATFLAYAAGMCLVVTTLTILVALFKTAVTRYVFKVLPVVGIVSSVLILIVGAYLVVYWLVEGDLINSFPTLSQ